VNTTDVGATERFFGAIEGTVFFDLGRGGGFVEGQPGLTGFTVYVDLNDNEQLDPDEPTFVTTADDPATPEIDEAGRYRFDGLSPARYFLCQVAPDGVLPEGWILGGVNGLPGRKFGEVALHGGELETGVDFANHIGITANDESVLEPESGTATITFTVNLTAVAQQDVTVPVSVAFSSGTATEGVDYDLDTTSLTFLQGEVSKTITVTVNADDLDEVNETLFVVYSGIATSQGVEQRRATFGTIQDSDDPPSLSVADIEFVEGDLGTADAVFTFVLSEPSGQTVEVQYATANGTATGAVDETGDYVTQTGTVTFAAGQTQQTVTITGTSDFTDEPDETFALNISNPVNVTLATTQAQATIRDDDPLLTVNSNADLPDLNPGNGVVDTETGVITLRAAVMEANALPGPDEIVLPAGTFKFTIDGRSEDSAATGDLDVTDSLLRIRGAGAGQTIVDAVGLDRVFHVLSGASLDIAGVTLLNGDVGDAQDGGAIDNAGNLTISDSEVRDNSARSGGAIFMRTGSTVSIVDSIIEDNAAVSNNGVGGAIAAFIGTGFVIDVSDSIFRDNIASRGGGAIFTRGTTTITDSLFERNQSQSNTGGTTQGGAIFTDDNSTLTITRSTFTQNEAISDGANSRAEGGAVFADSGSDVQIVSSTFDRNQAGGEGDTIYRRGGAISSRGDVDILNSTFSANVADTDGGAIFHQTGTLSANHVTMTLNNAGGRGGGISLLSGTGELKNTIVAANTATTADPDLSGAFTSLGNNLVGDGGASTGIVNGLSGDLAGTSGSVIDPRLAPLADNGGRTQTHALLVTQTGEILVFSPAVDAGAADAAVTTDQRGLPRNADGDNQNGLAVDIGAFELPLNRRPDLAPQVFSVTENVAVGTSVGQVVVSDPDGNLSSITLIGGDTSVFLLDAATRELRTRVPIDFETRSTYTVTAEAVDTDGLRRSAVMTINVNDQNEQPFVIGSGLDNRTRSDGDETELIDLEPLFDDVDDGDVLTFTLQQNTNAELVIVQVVGGNELQFAYQNYTAVQNRQPANVTIRATDADGLFVDDTFTVTVTPQATFEYSLVVTREITGEATVETLPTSLTSVLPDQVFFVEVWVRDLLVAGRPGFPVTSEGTTRGVVAAGVDLEFDPLLSSFQMINRSGNFSSDEAAAVDAVNGLVNNLGGESFSDESTAAKFGRLAAVEFRATGTGLQSFGLSLGGDEPATQREADGTAGGPINPSQISLGDPIIVSSDPEGGPRATLLFGSPITVALDETDVPSAVVTGDFDSRNGLDVIVAGENSNNVRVLLSAPVTGHTVTLNPGDLITNLNFGNRARPGEIRGVVFADVNNFGEQDAFEAGIANRRVFLDLDEDGVFDEGSETQAAEPSRLTDDSGAYAFTDLRTLTEYRVGLVPENGFVQTTPTDDGGLHVLTLDAGQALSDVSFGVRDEQAGVDGTSLKGSVFLDVNRNGERDPGEGVAGVVVYLDLNNNGVLDTSEIPVSRTTLADAVGSTTIDEAGTYEFESLAAATYSVRLESSSISGLRQTSPITNRFSRDDFEADGGPQAVTVGDFNGDGLQDIGVANEDTSNVSLLLQGAGDFASSPGSELDLGLQRGFGAFSVATADLDGDGDDDLVVANAFSENVSVLINTNGSFASAVNYTTGSTPRTVIAVDLDGDGDVDLATANEGGGSVSVLRNNGGGTFAPANSISFGTAALWVTAADLNGDDRPELVATLRDANQLAILRNNGNGNFVVDQRLATGRFPLSVSAADFDSDGNTDLAVSNFLDNSVSVLRNTGNATFVSLGEFATDAGPAAVVAIDLELDGNIDLAVTHQVVAGQTATDSVSLLRNDGTGRFLSPESAGVTRFPTGTLRFSIAANDIDGDGDPDLIVTDRDSERITLLSNELVPDAAVVSLSSQNDVTGADFTLEAVETPVNDDPIVEVDLRLVTSRTATDADGEVAALPDDTDYLDEWDEVFVEVWGSTPADTVSSAGSFRVDLPFNQDLFEALSIEYGALFTSSREGTIDNTNGVIADLGAATLRRDAGRDQFVLLARVAFRVRLGADLPNNRVGSYILPRRDGTFSLDIETIADPDGNQAGSDNPTSKTRPVWPVMFDLDDDGLVGFGDVAIFAQSFENSVEDSDTAFRNDFDRSGTVGFGDVTVFAQNFGRSRSSLGRQPYASNFPNAWDLPALLAGSDTAALESSLVSGQQPILPETLSALQNAAVDRFEESGLSETELDALRTVEIRVQDLPDGYLGLATEDAIIIDIDASGRGWFVDDTPHDDREFAIFEQSQIAEATEAQERFDLLTVIAHELGHHAGWDHSDGGLMNDSLQPGERRLFQPHDIDLQFAEFDQLGDLVGAE